MLQLGWMDYNADNGKEPCYYIVNTCENYIKELDKYSWREDKDQEPEDGNDHCINAEQYAWMAYLEEIG